MARRRRRLIQSAGLLAKRVRLKDNDAIADQRDFIAELDPGYDESAVFWEDDGEP